MASDQEPEPQGLAAELAASRREAQDLRSELEETNRGVLALYA